MLAKIKSITLTPLQINLIITFAQSALTLQIPKIVKQLSNLNISLKKDFRVNLSSPAKYHRGPKSNYISKKHSGGHNNIQPFFLKAARHVIAPYLSLFLNFVFTKGIPKTAKLQESLLFIKVEQKRK